MKEIEFILYVADQEKSKAFYEVLFEIKPSLNVPGMTEFILSDSVKLGLMPEIGIARVLRNKIPHPSVGNGIPRCELYLKVKDPVEYLRRGIDLGATDVSMLQDRDWGEKVGYIADPDGHIIAFAERLTE